MSDVVRVGVVAEGPADHAILEQILVAHFGPKDVEYTALHPELSVAFTAVSSDLGFGWGGVFRWARSVRDEGRGSLTGSYVIGAFDVLVVHVDCDVARASYADIGIDGDPNDLPCALPCPPATATIGLLEKVVLAWLGEVGPPKPLVLCIPAQATEGWLCTRTIPIQAQDARTALLIQLRVLQPNLSPGGSSRAGRRMSRSSGRVPLRSLEGGPQLSIFVSRPHDSMLL
jgi:hypothetical protein